IGMTVTPAGPEHIVFNPNPIRGGNTATATLYLTGVAPSGGLVVNLASENAAVLQVPSSVTVAAGQTSATFAVTTSGVAASTMGVVDAWANGFSIRIGLTLDPAAPEHMTFTPNPVTGGNTVTGTLILNGVAPAGGLFVNLASENSAVAQVLTTVRIS